MPTLPTSVRAGSPEHLAKLRKSSALGAEAKRVPEGSKGKSHEYVTIKHEGAWKHEHRVVAERALGRPLRRDEYVHHINMREDDNRPSNLLICDAGYHRWLHAQYAKRFAELHLGG